MKTAFRWIGWLEALSFLLLLGVAMPLKYAYGQPEMVSKVGMAHGVLFLAYLGLAWGVADEERWPRRQLLWALVASVLPLGTIVFDRKFLVPGAAGIQRSEA